MRFHSDRVIEQAVESISTDDEEHLGVFILEAGNTVRYLLADGSIHEHEPAPGTLLVSFCGRDFSGYVAIGLDDNEGCAECIERADRMADRWYAENA